MKLQSFGSLFDLLEAFPTEQSCIEYYEKLRWSIDVISPYDLTTKVYNYGNRKHRCNNTGLNFNVKTGTLFQDSKGSLKKWFVAILLDASHKKSISSCQLAIDITVTQKTAWFMLQRIRECFYCESNHQLDGDVNWMSLSLAVRTKTGMLIRKLRTLRYVASKIKLQVYES